MDKPVYLDPFNPTLRSEMSKSLTVSQEQMDLIDEVLRVGASDSKFAMKMKDAIHTILTKGVDKKEVKEKEKEKK